MVVAVIVSGIEGAFTRNLEATTRLFRGSIFPLEGEMPGRAEEGNL
jgi:hypothetical protein